MLATRNNVTCPTLAQVQTCARPNISYAHTSHLDTRTRAPRNTASSRAIAPTIQANMRNCFWLATRYNDCNMTLSCLGAPPTAGCTRHLSMALRLLHQPGHFSACLQQTGIRPRRVAEQLSHLPLAQKNENVVTLLHMPQVRCTVDLFGDRLHCFAMDDEKDDTCHAASRERDCAAQCVRGGV